MKLVKLSLAAVVAAGSFSFANAVALDEAIQNVDLSGYLRYRYDSTTTKDGDVKDRSDAQYHKLRAHLKFTADIADNFKAVAVMRYDSKDKSYSAASNADTESTFKVREGYLSYNNFDTTFNFGRMEVQSIWTDGLVGDGITVTNNSIEGVTLAAYMFDTFNKGEGDLFGNAAADAVEDGSLDDALTDLGITAAPGTTDAAKRALIAKGYNDLVYSHNLYGVAALVDFDPVSAGVWAAYLNKVGTFYAVDFAFNGGDEDFGYNVHAQYAGNSIKGDFKKKLDDVLANGSFYGIEAGVNVAGFDANLGYVGFGKKDKVTIHALHDKGQLINAGEIVMDGYHGGEGKRDYIFGTLGYTYDAVRFGVDIISGKAKIEGEEKIKLFEVTPRLSYKYSDKLNFSSFYAYGKTKQGDSKFTEKQIRLEAKYSF